MSTDGLDPRQPVFDFHVRLAPRPGAAEALLRLLDDAGITRAIVCAGGTMDRITLSRQLTDGGHVETDADNNAVLAAAARSGGRLVPFHFANPHRGPEVYRAAAAAVSGLELSPVVHGVGLGDPRVTALVTVAGEFRHPVYVAPLSRPGSGVADVVALAATFPAVTFVLGHTGVGNIDYHGLDLVAGSPNIMVETSGGYTDVLRFAVDRLGPSRLLFGTEAPLQHPRVELTKYAVLGLPADAWRRIAWDNAVRLLAPGSAGSAPDPAASTHESEGGGNDLDHQPAAADR
ncbi:amidohydrolase family protein [Micromonospora sp. NPDC049523]|uniref:amidohydrolase family protein n=1 Tax=Micromonospora sp. NPDC049523 TaxID=3155921 RepID=UPI0034168371